jgi:hypothetical protein
MLGTFLAKEAQTLGLRIESKRPRWYIPTEEKISFASNLSWQEGNELFKLHTISLVRERGWEIAL